MSNGTQSMWNALDGEPTATLKAVPQWLIVAMLLLFLGSAVYFDARGGWFEPKVYGPYNSLANVESFQPPPPSGPDLNRGRKVFEATCSLCHNSDGAGKPALAPPLAGSDWVNTAGVNRLIRIPLLGFAPGPITVSGQTYDFPAGMTAFGSLSDDDIAAVLSYIRKLWGNNASPVTAEQVHAVRVEIGNRTQPNTVEELKSLPE